MNIKDCLNTLSTKDMSDPRQKDFDERHTRLPTVTALTKREYFAAMAMQGILSSGLAEPLTDVHFKNIAEDAIRATDELLKQLQ